MEGSSPCIDATTTLFYRDKIAALHPAMFEPFHPKPATEDQLLEALKSILVEAEDYPGGLIAGLKSADFRIEALARVRIHQLSKNLEDIVVNDSRGFYTSRVFATYVMEGLAMLKEGVHPRHIEMAGLKAGMPMPPLALQDEVSLSLGVHVADQTRRDLAAEGRAYV
mgnify:CR=1 FL=1